MHESLSKFTRVTFMGKSDANEEYQLEAIATSKRLQSDVFINLWKAENISGSGCRSGPRTGPC